MTLLTLPSKATRPQDSHSFYEKQWAPRLAVCGHSGSTASELESEGGRGFLFLTDRDSTAEFPKFWKLKGKKKITLNLRISDNNFPFCCLCLCSYRHTFLHLRSNRAHTHLCSFYSTRTHLPFGCINTVVFHVVTVV